MDNSIEVIFSWLHISDIHYGHGSTEYEWEQEFVLNTMLQDIRGLSEEAIPSPNAILVTGDIAYSGAVKSNEEYDKARKWLFDVANFTKLAPGDIFIVPGNHDIQRNVVKKDTTGNIRRLLDSLRKAKGEKLDDALKNKENKNMLADRMINYLEFAKNFAPICRYTDLPEEYQLYWFDKIKLVKFNMNINLLGLNTALLADVKDKGKLYLGNTQLSELILNRNESVSDISIALSHHPFDWLRDGAASSNWVKNRCNIHLFGHIHESSVESHRSGTGQEIIKIVAGAAHNEQNHIVGHGYNIGAFVYDVNDNRFKLRIWTKQWDNEEKKFYIDVKKAKRGYFFSELPLNIPFSLEDITLESKKKEQFDIDSLKRYIKVFEDTTRNSNQIFRDNLSNNSSIFGLGFDNITSCVLRDKEERIQKWHNDWKQENNKYKNSLVVFGREQIGKSSAVANCLFSLDYSYPIFFINTREITSSNHTVRDILNEKLDDIKIVDGITNRLKFYQDKQSLFILVIDGINQLNDSLKKFITNFYEDFWYFAAQLILTCRTEECLEDLDDLEDLTKKKFKKIMIGPYNDREFTEALAKNNLTLAEIQQECSLEDMEKLRNPKEFKLFLDRRNLPDVDVEEKGEAEKQLLSNNPILAKDTEEKYNYYKKASSDITWLKSLFKNKLSG